MSAASAQVCLKQVLQKVEPCPRRRQPTAAVEHVMTHAGASGSLPDCEASSGTACHCAAETAPAAQRGVSGFSRVIAGARRRKGWQSHSHVLAHTAVGKQLTGLSNCGEGIPSSKRTFGEEYHLKQQVKRVSRKQREVGAREAAICACAVHHVDDDMVCAPAWIHLSMRKCTC